MPVILSGGAHIVNTGVEGPRRVLHLPVPLVPFCLYSQARHFRNRL